MVVKLVGGGMKDGLIYMIRIIHNTSYIELLCKYSECHYIKILAANVCAVFC